MKKIYWNKDMVRRICFTFVLLVCFLSKELLASDSRNDLKLEKLKNIKRYYPNEYYNYMRGNSKPGYSHPLMTGLLFNFTRVFLHNDENTAQNPGGTPKVKYPITINLYSDIDLTKAIGKMHFVVSKYDKKYYTFHHEKQVDGYVKYKGQVVCRYISEGQQNSSREIRNIIYDKKNNFSKNMKTFLQSTGVRYSRPYRGNMLGFINFPVKDKITGGCERINYFAPWIEVNNVYNNSYEILQKDGSSIFLSKKELGPYVYNKISSNRDYLNKTLTKKQLIQLESLFDQVKNDLQSIAKDKFIKKYNLNSNYGLSKKDTNHAYNTIYKNKFAAIHLLRDFHFDYSKSSNSLMKFILKTKKYNLYIDFGVDSASLVLKRFYIDAYDE